MRTGSAVADVLSLPYLTRAERSRSKDGVSRARLMKYLLTLLATTSLFTSPFVLAENATDGGMSDLCTTYAEEDGISADKKPAYIKECLASMTDLSESVQEPLPVVADGTDAPSVTPSSEQVNSDPENLVKGELVDTPDPAAEQLDAGKK